MFILFIHYKQAHLQIQTMYNELEQFSLFLCFVSPVSKARGQL